MYRYILLCWAECIYSVIKVCDVYVFLVLLYYLIIILVFFILIWVTNQVDGDCALKVVPRRAFH